MDKLSEEKEFVVEKTNWESKYRRFLKPGVATKRFVRKQTFRRLFKKKGQHGRSEAKKCLLPAKVRVARLAWCRQKQQLSADDWSKFVFSD